MAEGLSHAGSSKEFCKQKLHHKDHPHPNTFNPVCTDWPTRGACDRREPQIRFRQQWRPAPALQAPFITHWLGII